MITRFSRTVRLVVAVAALSGANQVWAQGRVYGVMANGTLFTFLPGSPATATTISNMGIVTKAIDLRPTTTAGDPNRPFYGLSLGATTSVLWKINTTTAAVTPVGAGFPSMVAGSYDLRNQQIGFDFNPTTLQANGNFFIRVIATNGVNMRISADTGDVVGVDTSLLIQPGGNSPFPDAAAYINDNKAVMGETTTLYDMDIRNSSLYLQDPPTPAP